MKSSKCFQTLVWVSCFCLFSSLFSACVPKVDAAERLAGVYDCQTTITETNIIAQSSAITTRYIGKITLTRKSSSLVEVTVEGRPDLTVQAEVEGGRLLVRKQIIQVLASNGYQGPAAALGDGTADGSTLTISYLASAGANSYSMNLQGRGVRRK